MVEEMGFGDDPSTPGAWGVMITLNYRIETAGSVRAFAEYCFGDSSTPFGRHRIAASQ